MDGPRKKLDPNLSHLFACRLMWEETGDPTALIEALGWLRPRLPSWYKSALARALESSRRNDKGSPRRVTIQHTDRERHTVRWMAVRHFKKPGVSWDKAITHAVDELADHWAGADFETTRKSYHKVQGDLKKGRIALYQIWCDRHLAPVEPHPHKTLTDGEGIAKVQAKAEGKRAAVVQAAVMRAVAARRTRGRLG